MTKKEKAETLLHDPDTHYGCAQVVLASFAEELGITEAQAMAFAQNLSGGMGHGYVCGAVTGALIAMGGLGLPQETRKDMIREIKEHHGCTDCASLLKAAVARGESRKEHCPRMMLECIAFVCRQTGIE